MSSSTEYESTPNGSERGQMGSSSSSSTQMNTSSAASRSLQEKTHTRNSSASSNAQYVRTQKYNPFSNWDFTPTEQGDARILREEKDEVLRKYQENSHIYNHEEYGDELSDDDWDILRKESEEPKRKKKKGFRERWNEVSNSSSGSNSTHNTSSNSSHTDVKNTVVTGTNDQLFENVPASLRTQQDRMERGEPVSKEGAVEQSFKARFERRKQVVKEYLQEHKTLNWTLFWTALTVTVLVCVIFPVSASLGTFSHGKDAEVIVYEHITDYVYPTLSSIRTDLVDPDTPQEARKRTTMTGDEWPLVFSDEFNAEGRTFYPNMDQFWQGADLHYAATQDLEWYDPDAAVTKEGTLRLKMDSYHNHNLFYRSGMLQSWNKLCFSEGILEISAKMPGSAYAAGLWPGLWTLGNLARPGYLASTDGVWPYSYDACDAGITPNQSSPDGLSYLPGQRLSSCTCKGEDHPNRGTGRGAPEIDLLEGAHSTKFSSNVHFGVAAQTIQIAPFDIWYQPDYDYVAIHNLTKSNVGSFMGTPYQEMLSVQTTVNETWYEAVVRKDKPWIKTDTKDTHFQKYAVEYLAKKKKHRDNYMTFFLGDEPTMTVNGDALHPNGNIDWRDMPKEPMSIVLNLGLSTSWSMIQWLNIIFPVTFEIDYVRIYQAPGTKEGLTCDPSGFPTTQYINDHLDAYMNPNLTSWEKAGYSQPRNKLTGNC